MIELLYWMTVSQNHHNPPCGFGEAADWDQVIRLIAPPLLSRHDVMDFQEPGSPAARRITAHPL